ncbi:hypothetical protein [Mesorhizobium sp.]|uniref:hypothetical protein n=1 Tax=Mesorhizobium sp. TaxID=1871066 RepID=UPI000FE81B6F|nr:hypothetical protein [Mesorhizobium sp.]RWB04819.1 MAG: catalase [Mesorhizobium sp.]RWO22655.1 MAG: catalase [Mesorhizobium sp.]
MAQTADLAVVPTAAQSPSTAWREVVGASEDTLFEGFAREIMASQREVAAKTGGPLRRGFHAKLHAGFVAEFQVLTDLPDHARFGVFREPRVFPALVRFSNGEPAPRPDKHPEPRGVAIKLIGVHGPKLLRGQEDAITQDFLATSHSVTSTVRNVEQFMAFIRASRNRLTMLFTLARAVGAREAVRILRALINTVILSRVRSMAREQFSSTAPIKLGPYAVKFTVCPAEGTEPTESRPLTPNFLRDELAERLRRADLMLDFLVQFYVDDTRTPIEDTSVAWDAPLVKVAKVRIPNCDLDHPPTHAISEEVDRLSFSPWHATEDHRPLGNIMRARRVAYEASSALRHHSPEPTDLPHIELRST